MPERGREARRRVLGARGPHHLLYKKVPKTSMDAVRITEVARKTVLKPNRGFGTTSMRTKSV